MAEVTRIIYNLLINLKSLIFYEILFEKKIKINEFSFLFKNLSIKLKITKI